MGERHDSANEAYRDHSTPAATGQSGPPAGPGYGTLPVMDAVTPSADLGADAPGVASGQPVATEVFDIIANRLGERSEAIALFTETGCSFEDWCTWEGLAACRAQGWTVQPKPRYADLGVTGSREFADLLVFDPARGWRVLLELAIVHDWTTNKWIDTLDGDTEKLGRSLAGGIIPLQMILAAWQDSAIAANPTWQAWLGMSNIWDRPTELKRTMRLGSIGQMVLQGWVVSPAH